MGDRTFVLPFDKGFVEVRVADRHIMGVVEPRELPSLRDPCVAVADAIANPVDQPPLAELVVPGSRVAILVSDVTRPSPTRVLLPPVLDVLARRGVRDRDITIVFALGIHRPHRPEEQVELIGPEIASTHRYMDSVASGFRRIGNTRRGTVVEIAKTVAEADLCVCTGNVELHYFAGYSGGAKAILPGVASRDTITLNHGLMLLPEACAGRCDGNPVREDIEDAADLLPRITIVNAVLNSHREMVACVVGDHRKAHRVACRVVDQMYKLPVPGTADVVLASAGGFPKDLNLYQAQKALENAAFAVRPGGTVILVASCREGFGNETFSRWFREASKPDEVIERLRRGFELGGHKAAAVARVLQKARVFLVSALDPSEVRALRFAPFESAQAALEAALADHGAGARVLVMPNAGLTLPCPQE